MMLLKTYRSECKYCGKSFVPTALEMDAAKQGYCTFNCMSRNLKNPYVTNEVLEIENRGSRQYFHKGSAHPNAVLNEDKVREIKKYLRQGLTVKEISCKMLIKIALIEQIKYKRNWKHVD